jgi:hypothetical protein
VALRDVNHCFWNTLCHLNHCFNHVHVSWKSSEVATPRRWHRKYFYMSPGSASRVVWPEHSGRGGFWRFLRHVRSAWNRPAFCAGNMASTRLDAIVNFAGVIKEGTHEQLHPLTIRTLRRAAAKGVGRNERCGAQRKVRTQGKVAPLRVCRRAHSAPKSFCPNGTLC